MKWEELLFSWRRWIELDEYNIHFHLETAEDGCVCGEDVCVCGEDVCVWWLVSVETSE